MSSRAYLRVAGGVQEILAKGFQDEHGVRLSLDPPCEPQDGTLLAIELPVVVFQRFFPWTNGLLEHRATVPVDVLNALGREAIHVIDPRDEGHERLQARMNAEAEFGDPEVMARFKREHEGMTPLQHALAHFPEQSEAIYRERPHLRPPKDTK